MLLVCHFRKILNITIQKRSASEHVAHGQVAIRKLKIVAYWPLFSMLIYLFSLYCDVKHLAVAILLLTAIFPWNLFCRNHSCVFI